MRCPACKDLFDLVDVKFCPTCGAALYSAPPDPLLGQTVGGRYKVQRLLAEGGMGRVYLAEQELGGIAKKVAIKVLLSDPMARDADTKRFERECRTVAELEHPNTIKFFDFGMTDDGDVFIAMEFLSGQSLAQVLKAGPLFPERVDLILGQICGSLQEAHDRGIVHRDLKPDNIILTSPGGSPDFVKVLDFGIAKRMGGRDPKLTPLGVVLGSPPYMSPEQFTLQDVDHKSDIYSLGIVAYQLLTGVLPFNASDPLEWAALHMGVTPTPIEAHGVSIPPAMGTAIHRALSKQPNDRPSSMREFYSQLTIGAGSLMPGRASSVMPLSPSQFPLPPRSPRSSSLGRDSEVPDSDDVGTRVRDDSGVELPSTEIKVQKNAETIEAPRLYSDSHVPSSRPLFENHDTSDGVPPVPSLEQPAASALVHSAPMQSAPMHSSPIASAAAISSMASSGPAISAHEISSPDLSLWNPESQDIGRSTGTTALRSGKGTLVMAASEPPPRRARHTMPDLLPPTVREPVLVPEARSAKSIVVIALGLVLVGAIATAVAWFAFFRPSSKPEEKRKASSSSSAAATVTPPGSSEAPRAPSASPTQSARPNPAASTPSPSASAPTVATAEPAPTVATKEKMSPCQTAIFSAVSGNCEVAKRAYERCEADSPYRASATRSVTGLCP